ncbi:MAG: hypothetical protein GWN00_22585 [Aliifodinibius sp.]|nr:GNAT family N-acetyltransferase [Phycisphaerae bacterium]NIT58905.1 GNAT family N-acetyltransferase [Fodinibius sp.]NIW98115.1 hypothetical protein [Phycisphaerae bacterium]NIY27488.1 hypothetical protein [Fodinibius sp.]
MGYEFSFLPYRKHDGVPTLRDSDISNLYNKCCEQGIDEIVFHDGSINDAAEFTDYVKRPDVIFYVVYYDVFPFGFFWLNRIEKTNAHIHFVIFKDYWGKGLSVEAGKKVVQMCLDSYPTIMGRLLPENKYAINYVSQLGFNLVGLVPNLIWSKKDSKPVAGLVVYITKEELEDEGLQ